MKKTFRESVIKRIGEGGNGMANDSDIGVSGC